MAKAWGYSKHNGPCTWHEHFPKAGGRKQSPIDIIAKEAQFDKSLTNKALHAVYHPTDAATLTNTGASASLAYDCNDTSLSGGPLDHPYRLVQFHFHWGKTSERGSEHTVDGKAFSAEVHLVHYNTALYKSFAEAAKSDTGLCVLGAFIKVGAEHPELKKLVSHLGEIAFAGQEAKIGEFNPATLLPEELSAYWTYPGSLTTPTCDESVTWIVFRDPIEVSEQQLDELRKMHGTDIMNGDGLPCCLGDNFRPTQPISGRQVFRSFP